MVLRGKSFSRREVLRLLAGLCCGIYLEAEFALAFKGDRVGFASRFWFWEACERVSSGMWLLFFVIRDERRNLCFGYRL